MEAKGTRKRWTYSEFARLPESGSTRYEIIDDELVVTPSPGTRHQRVARELMYRLVHFDKEHGIGEFFSAPFDVLFAEGDYFEPDILFVRRERADVLSDRGVEGPPDLVIEILSPSTAERDRGIKLDRYKLFGVPEYWIVDPEEGVVEVWNLAAGETEAVRYGTADVLLWTPDAGGPTLELRVEEVLGD